MCRAERAKVSVNALQSSRTFVAQTNSKTSINMKVSALETTFQSFFTYSASSTFFSSSSAWLSSLPPPRLMLWLQLPPMPLHLLWPMLLLPPSTRLPFHVPTPPTLQLPLSTPPRMWHLLSMPLLQSTPRMPHLSPPMPLLPPSSPRCWRSKSINPSPHTSWYPNLDYVQINWAQIKIDKRFLFGWR